MAYTAEEKQELADRRGTYYRIQEGDVLSCAFSYLEDLNQDSILVLPDGSVNMMGVDRLELAGLTMTDADSMVTSAYAHDYRDPDLTLILRETSGRQVYVMGEVNNPGLYKLPRRGIDILGAIATAGGFSEDASKGGAVVVRAGTEGYYLEEVDLSNFDGAAYTELAMLRLEPYDIVYVPRSGMGDIGYLSKTVLSALVQVTRIASDIQYISRGGLVKF